MRRTALVLATMALAMMLVSGVALAGVFDGDDGDNRLIGTDARDKMYGHGGEDMVRGRDGRDVLSGGEGDDALYGSRGEDILNGDTGVDDIYGGPGNDYISSIGDNAVDVVDCGGGTDSVDRSLVLGPDKADAFVDCEKSVS